MKYLETPEHDDHSTIRQLAEMKTLNSYPMLRTVIGEIEELYWHYVSVGGNAWRIKDPLGLPQVLADALKTHYKTKPADLEIIDLIRRKSSPDVCPMCGSLNPTQVDHVAPKDRYPEYSFFTRNLVPACSCNGFKGVTFKGEQEGQRVLHPYYDNILSERLVYILFSHNFDAPRVELKVCECYRTDAAVNYHVDNILRKTNIITWASAKWAAICRSPEAVFPCLKGMQGQIDEEDIRQAIGLHLDAKDEECGTPNNWYSMVFLGVLTSPGALEHVMFRINALRNGDIFPD